MGFALAAAASHSEGSSAVTVTATVRSARYRIGDRIPISIRAQCGVDIADLEPLHAQEIEPFEILAIRPDPEGPTRSPCDRAWTIEVTTFDAGLLMIPAVPVRYRRAGASSFETVSTSPIALFVDAPAIDPGGDLKPLKPVITTPSSNVRPWPVWAAVVAALMAALATFAVWLRHIARGTRARGQSEPARRPHILADIAKLEHELPESEAAVEPFYTNLSRLIREFIELTCGVSALTISSSELVESLRDSQPAPIAADIEKLVRFIDHVKYGGWLPPSSEHAKAVRYARELMTALGRSRV